MEPIKQFATVLRFREKQFKNSGRNLCLLKPAAKVSFLFLFLTFLNRDCVAQYAPGQFRNLETHQLPSSTPPPVITPPSLPKSLTLSQFRVSVFKDFIKKASQPQYRSANGKMYDLQPLTDFFLWVADLPDNPETTEMLKHVTRPLPSWSVLYGRVAQVTDGNGILLWKYEQPEMVLNAKLVRLRENPWEKALVDGDIVVVYAMNEGPYSYIDTQHVKSTVSSFDYGKPVTEQQVDLFIQKRPLPAIRLPTLTNNSPFHPKS
jgi:hypothetical protein